MSMTDDEFDEFLARSAGSLQTKQDTLTKEYGFGTFDQWGYDQTTGVLQFKDADGRVRVEADAFPIATHSPQAGSWKWAWANPSLSAALGDKAETIRELSAKTGMNVFESDGIRADEETAWDLVAMVVEHLGARGCYRAPAGQVHLYLVIADVRTV